VALPRTLPTHLLEDRAWVSVAANQQQLITKTNRDKQQLLLLVQQVLCLMTAAGRAETAAAAAAAAASLHRKCHHQQCQGSRLMACSGGCKHSSVCPCSCDFVVVGGNGHSADQVSS